MVYVVGQSSKVSTTKSHYLLLKQLPQLSLDNLLNKGSPHCMNLNLSYKHNYSKVNTKLSKGLKLHTL